MPSPHLRIPGSPCVSWACLHILHLSLNSLWAFAQAVASIQESYSSPGPIGKVFLGPTGLSWTPPLSLFSPYCHPC